MSITITISERPDGDIAVHIKEEQSMATMREARYADAITGSIKAHLNQAMPAIVKQVRKLERN